jgi:type I restriction enzyme R subunit
MTPEEQAREKINRLIEAAGWAYREEALAGRRSGRGFSDYVLYHGGGLAVAVLEAKRAEVPSLSGKEQAREYADSIGVRHVFLSNGDLHYHWVTDSGNPVRIMALPTLDELDHLGQQEAVDRSPLWETPVDENFLRTRTMRPYQLAAVQAVQEYAEAGRHGFLLEMATGTGKTTVAAAICRLYLQAGVAERILFLVDRDELYLQAVGDLDQALEGQYRVVGYRDRDEDWTAPIMVATVQAINAATSHGEPIPPEWFQLIVSDEAHRSISGPRHRDIFDAFNCDKVGLTATPRQYLTVGDPNDEASAAGREARTLRDTYYAFGLTPGEPTFEYTMEQADADGYLVMPHALDVRTDVTTQLMSEEGFQLTLEDYESGEDISLAFHEKDYGRTFLSPDTNREFAERYIEHALREPETDIIGKGIIYCVSRAQAAQFTNELNKAAETRWPGKYRSDFAVQITHDVDRATQMGRAFANQDGLNGADSTIPGYKTSKTRVCVTVGMMTTGYDCPDLLNLGFCRPVKSPTDYIQMKGRGTRRYEFTENVTDQVVRDQLVLRPKEQFRIIDYFGVCEYFGEGDLYGGVVLDPPSGGGSDGGGGPGIPVQPYIRHGKDQTESITELSMDAEGAITDRSAILEQREAANQDLGEAFEQYLALHPITDSYEQENARRLFEAYATDEATRRAIDSRTYSALGNAITIVQYELVPAEHRQAIPEYIRNLNSEVA